MPEYLDLRVPSKESTQTQINDMFVKFLKVAMNSGGLSLINGKASASNFLGQIVRINNMSLDISFLDGTMSATTVLEKYIKHNMHKRFIVVCPKGNIEKFVAFKKMHGIVPIYYGDLLPNDITHVHYDGIIFLPQVSDSGGFDGLVRIAEQLVAYADYINFSGFSIAGLGVDFKKYQSNYTDYKNDASGKIIITNDAGEDQEVKIK